MLNFFIPKYKKQREIKEIKKIKTWLSSNNWVVILARKIIPGSHLKLK
jgi:hypothetical protein